MDKVHKRAITKCRSKIVIDLSFENAPGTLVSSTNKTDRHDISEILLKVALNTINQPTITISDRGFITILYCGS
jgi:hypothetical protein